MGYSEILKAGRRLVAPAAKVLAIDVRTAARRRQDWAISTWPRWLAHAGALAIAALAAGPARAQATSADTAAQEHFRQQERERQLREQQERTPDVRLPRPVAGPEFLPREEAPCFAIDRIILGGEAAERFQWALAAADVSDGGIPDAATPRCLGTQGINLAMRRIQNAILGRGYVTTRVLAEPQDLAGGTLRLTLLPGRIRAVRFAPGTSPRATLWNAVPAAPGDLLNLRDVEQALENFKRVPTAEADIQIVPAEGLDAQPGESDVVIQWRQDFPFRLSFSADDAGSKATGRYQGSMTLAYDHWWTLNDLFYISFNHDLGGGDPGTRGTRGGTVHYSLPFGDWLLGMTASRSRYHQSVAGASQTYIYSGRSESQEIKLTRLLYRDAVRKTHLSLRGWQRSSSNFIDDTEVEVQRRRVAGWDLAATHREFIGAASLDLNLNYRRGTGAMNSLHAPEEAFGEGSSRPRLLSADLQLNLPFAVGGQQLRYGGSWRGQWNGTPLVPQDRFAIGNRYTVRGFDGESTLSAERGWLVRNDLGWILGQQEIYLGVDYGEVGGPSSQALAGTHLSGAAIGLRGSHQGVGYDFFVAAPIAKPEGFQTAAWVAGFTLNWSL